MAPKGSKISPRRSHRSSKTAVAPSATKLRRSSRKKKHEKSKNQEPPADIPTTSSSNSCDTAGITGGCCVTPKARRFRIPAIETCPPAPKKPRVATKNCLLHRQPISFFAHPDIELFFNLAFRGISV